MISFHCGEIKFHLKSVGTKGKKYLLTKIGEGVEENITKLVQMSSCFSRTQRPLKLLPESGPNLLQKAEVKNAGKPPYFGLYFFKSLLTYRV